jgi:hypothetical protein
MRLATILSSAAHWSRAVLAVGAVSLLSACDYNFWRMDGHQSTIKVEAVSYTHLTLPTKP